MTIGEQIIAAIFGEDKLKPYSDVADQLTALVQQHIDEQVRLRLGEKKREPARTNLYHCGHCSFEGACYGIPSSVGVSAPFCTRCGMNNRLCPL